ncbi:MAG: DUF349 domain-containing protein [Paludibacteraceae bacterium]|nr:DUF349 domain-containing protein [Paludibacteraceae bacterium]
MDSLENKDLHAPETVQAEENAVNETTEVQEVSQVVDEIEVSGVEPAEDIANEEQEETTAAETEEAPEDKPLTKEGIVEQFKVLLSGQVSEIKEQADLLKTQFYRIFRQEQEAARKQWEELGEKAEDYKPVIDEIEQQFRHLLEIYRQQRQEEREKREAEMQQNQLRKENIIAQMKQMAESDTADVTENLKKMRELRGEWKSIGAVPPTVATLLWKEYNLYQEKFYDLVKINNELREYDFRKNLEQKTAICEQAEALKDKGDVVEAFRQLQQLHDEWANIGPVARELREDLWNRFKEASTYINKRHQEHFEKLHAAEEDNLRRKQEIIEKLKALNIEDLTSNKMWDDATAAVNELQAEWRTIGFAPKKMNQQIYDEYRSLCDGFFKAKTSFYKKMRDELQQNLQKKRSLLAQAEALKDSEEWKEATDKLVKLQKQWKEIGPVARKYSEDIWKQFSAACDNFFERKKASVKDVHQQEKENLVQKKAIIKEIEELAVTTKEETLAKLHELINHYNEIGFVPFRDKDKLFKQFRAATDKIFDQLNIEQHNRRIEDFSKRLENKDDNALLNERRRLVRQYEVLEQEIKTAENNILFFTSGNKKGNKLVEEMQKKIEDQKKQLAELEERINLIDSKLE